MTPSRTKRGKGARQDAKAAGRRHAGILLGLSLLGLAVSLYLTYVHQRLRQEPEWQSACAFNAVVSCDSALTSRYGSIAGTPLAAIGAWFYVVTACVAAAAYRRQGRRSPQSAAFVLLVAGGLATVVSIVLAGLSFSIGSVCPLCAVLYGVNVALLLVSWRAWRVTGAGIGPALAAEAQAWKARAVPAAAALLLLIAVGWFFSREGVVPPAQATVPAAAPQSRLCAAIDQARSGGESPIELIAYTDFQCDRCRDLNHALRPVREDPRLRIVHRHCPVERACNPLVTRAGHAGACLQALAAICARAEGRYDAFADALFDGGPREEAGLVALAESLGLAAATFRSCLVSVATKAALDGEVAAAAADGVQGTPTLIVNGAKQAGRLGPGDLACLASLRQP